MRGTQTDRHAKDCLTLSQRIERSGRINEIRSDLSWNGISGRRQKRGFVASREKKEETSAKWKSWTGRRTSTTGQTTTCKCTEECRLGSCDLTDNHSHPACDDLLSREQDFACRSSLSVESYCISGDDGLKHRPLAYKSRCPSNESVKKMDHVTSLSYSSPFCAD